MFPWFRKSDRDERDQYGIQSSAMMSMSDDGGQTTLCGSTEQQPTTLSANPDEPAAEVLFNPLMTRLVPLVLKDLDSVMDRLKKEREKAFRHQTEAGSVLASGQNVKPPSLDPDEIEEKIRKDLRNLYVLRRDLRDQVQEAQGVYDQVQELRRGYPTLSSNYNFLSERQLQDRLALFDGQQHALKQQTRSLQITYQSLKAWNRSAAAPTPENWNARQSNDNM